MFTCKKLKPKNHEPGEQLKTLGKSKSLENPGSERLTEFTLTF
jgi:hypothetical protein